LLNDVAKALKTGSKSAKSNPYFCFMLLDIARNECAFGGFTGSYVSF